MRIFRNGIQLPDYKLLSLSVSGFQKAPIPEHVLLSLSQHEGLPAVPIVRKGAEVCVGTKIAAAQGDFSSNLHSSLCGRVVEVSSDFIKIESSGTDDWDPAVVENKNWHFSSREDIVAAVREAGVIGMGGGGFPTHLKLASVTDAGGTLIVNGCESEPFVTCDHLLMLNRPADVLRGAELLLRGSGLKRCVIAVEDNKLEAVELLLSKARSLQLKEIEVKTLPFRYPQGAESELARRVLGWRRGKDPLPLIVNVATSVAVYEAVRFRKPLVERLVTVTGHCTVEAKNLMARIGTEAAHLVKSCKGFLRDPSILIFGGPMAGRAVSRLSEPITKSTTAILALAEEYIHGGEEKPCIRCGLCADVCPEHLIPEMLLRGLKHKKELVLEEFGLSDCIQCGNCTYICPSKIPLADWLREGKEKWLPKETSGNVVSKVKKRE